MRIHAAISSLLFSFFAIGYYAFSGDSGLPPDSPGDSPENMLAITSQSIKSINLSQRPRDANRVKWTRERISYETPEARYPSFPYGDHYCMFDPLDHATAGQTENYAPLTFALHLRPQSNAISKNGSVARGCLIANYIISSRNKTTGGLAAGSKIGLFGKQFTSNNNGLFLNSECDEAATKDTFFSLPIYTTGNIDCQRIHIRHAEISIFSDLNDRHWLILCHKTPEGIEIKQGELFLDPHRAVLTAKLPLASYIRKVGDTHKVSQLSFTIKEFAKQNSTYCWVNIGDPVLSTE